MRKYTPYMILAIGLLALAIDLLPNLKLPDSRATDGTRPIETKLGLDLRGGLRVEYQVQPVDGVIATAADVATIRDIIERRVNSTGVAEPLVQTQGSDRIIVELPGVSDPDAIRALLGTTGRLDFIPLPAETYGSINVATGEPTEGVKPVPGQGALLDDPTLKPLSAPYIQSAITGGEGQISGGSGGGFALEEATSLVTILKFGSLPFPIAEIGVTEVKATLGAAFLGQALFAGAVGILLVFLFMIMHYRLAGLVASGALIFYMLIVLALFRLIPVTLTLAGIAGFVLSIGMAVDANILIFERTKEELRIGKGIIPAVEAGFSRAWNSILDSNVSSLITAFILFYFGSSTIKGFALVLIIGVLCSMFTAISLTRVMLRAVIHQPRFSSPYLYGVGRGDLDSEAAALKPAGAQHE